MTPEVRRAVEVALVRLSKEERAARLAWCEEHGQAEVEPVFVEGSIAVDLMWGGKLLTVVHRDAFAEHRPEDPIYRSAFGRYRRVTGDGASESADPGPMIDSANRAASDAKPGGPPEGLPPRTRTTTQDPAGPPRGLP